MKSFLILFSILLSFSIKAETTVGYLTGFHIITKDLNNQHPFVELSDKVLIYKNSFDKLSVAGYYTIGSENFKLRMGFTTGYKQKMKYKGFIYETPALVDNFMLFLAPSFEVKSGNFKYIAAILGNSFNFGIGFSF